MSLCESLSDDCLSTTLNYEIKSCYCNARILYFSLLTEWVHTVFDALEVQGF